ncbi:hypothetical protein BIY23_02510 [Wolbachia pipientis]|uniref:Uncharacterized protein n=1 Tax=Wolbachia pipientis TaxID=955 RepID=A0A1E7QJQ7_WOLPI|nr:hypothetical protein [Wolbachia pipientis]OEY86708.1 hypothetical protein BIY23_02510 [Wolbachia pipientis]
MDIIKAAEQVYNSYLLWYKLDELSCDNGKKLSSVISEVIDKNNTEIELKLNNTQYTIQVNYNNKENGSYELTALASNVISEVKHVSEYSDEDIIALWASSKVSFEKIPSKKDSRGFATYVRDEVRQKDVKVGGLGKMVPFNLRFHNFYKVIEMLKIDNIPLRKKLRLANNAAPGSGKTGDIALLKLLAYFANIPCITLVPTDLLKKEMHDFDRKFLPDIVADAFALSLNDNNTEYATSTFEEAFNEKWCAVNNLYDERSENRPALICIDEARELTQKPKLLKNASKLSCHNAMVIFTATPDSLLNKSLGIKQQILLSPKEKVAFEIGRLPIIHHSKIKSSNIQEVSQTVNSSQNLAPVQVINLARDYINKVENTYVKLNKKGNMVEQLGTTRNVTGNVSQAFINDVSQLLDSQSYKVGIIAAEEDQFDNIYDAIFSNSSLKEREEQSKRSLIRAVKELNLGLNDDRIELLIEENVNTQPVRNLLPSIKLCNIIDALNEYKKSSKIVTKDGIKTFIQDKYKITDSHETLNYNSQITDAIVELNGIRSEYSENVKRNYPADKKLHEYIFTTFPKIAAFCKQDVVVSQSVDKGISRLSIDEEGNSYQASYIVEDNTGNIKNMISMIKSGFVPYIISKELAVGFDSKKIDKAVVISTSSNSSVSDPMLLFQVMGRVGRSNRRGGSVFFDVFTTHDIYLDIENINALSGEEILAKLERGNQEYQRNRQSTVDLVAYDPLCHDNRITNGASRASPIAGWIGAVTNTITGVTNQLYFSLKNLIASSEHAQTHEVAQIQCDAADVSATLLLASVAAMKITGQKYIHTVDQASFSSETQANVWYITNDIIEKFEQALKNAAEKSGVTMTSLYFNPMSISSAIDNKIRNGQYSQVRDILYSAAKNVCTHSNQTEKFLDIIKGDITNIISNKTISNNSVASTAVKSIECLNNDKVPLSSINGIAVERIKGNLNNTLMYSGI